MWLMVVWIILCVIVATVAHSKGRDSAGWLIYGLILGPIALIHVLVLPPRADRLEERTLRSGSGRKCPHCAEIIKPDAKVCRYCGRDVEPTGSRPVIEERKRRCLDCMKLVPISSRRCPECGAGLP